MGEKRVVAIIPARGGSKGIPNKNILPLAGRPLVAWSIGHARNSDLVDAVYVSTDDDDIAKVSEEWGAEVIRRPPEIAGDTASSESALLHALDEIEKTSGPVDLVVFLQATSPVRAKDDIDRAIALLREEQADSLFSCTPIEDFFIWEEKDGEYHSANYDYKSRKPRQDIKPQYLENGSIYVFTPDLLRAEENRLGGKIRIYEMPFGRSYQIDEPDDVAVCEFYLERLIESENSK